MEINFPYQNRANPDRESSEPVFRSLALIEENIRQKLTVTALADSIYLSRTHYQRLFREAMGETVMCYVTRRRLALAAADLAETDESILAIALKYGYDSHEGFTRSFRAHMGISPREYRKYHSSICPVKKRRERIFMTHSKTTDEIIRNLNQLIVRIRDTAEYTRRNKSATPDAADFYSAFWDAAADRADSIADELGTALGRVTELLEHPDGISARFSILRTMDTVEEKNRILSFQIQLLAARAKPVHRTAFSPIVEQYVRLAQDARIKLDKISEFFQELTALIFREMRENGVRTLTAAAEAGCLAAEKLLKVPSLPYGYLGDEIVEIAEELSALALEEVSLSLLEDYLFRLDIVASAAEVDLLRDPSQRQLLNGIPVFRKRLEEAVLFFRELSADVVRELPAEALPAADAVRALPAETDQLSAADAVPALPAETDRLSAADALRRVPEQKQAGKTASVQRAGRKQDDRILQSNILLFYLKGEMQKLEQAQLLNTAQKETLDRICREMNQVTRPICHPERQAFPGEGAAIFRRVYEELSELADQLGDCGGPLRFLAEEIQGLASPTGMC